MTLFFVFNQLYFFFSLTICTFFCEIDFENIFDRIDIVITKLLIKLKEQITSVTNWLPLMKICVDM